MAFKPFSVRRGLREPFELVDGIPPHIVVPLVEWFDKQVVDDFVGPDGRLLSSIISILQWEIAERDPVARYRAILEHMSYDEDAFLDALDLLCTLAGERDLDELDQILETGLSLYRVRVSSPRGLEERLSEQSRAVIAQAASASDAAGEHIAEAWASAYGRSPNPTAAWNSAVKAVEFLLQPIVEPKSGSARLGTMMPVLRRKPDDWTFVVAGKDADNSARPFLQAAEIITYEPGRHGTDPNRATIEQARVVVLQAVTIIEWLRAGALTRADT